MIHKFSQGGYYMILDVNSNAFFTVDEPAYALADYAGAGMTEHIPEAALTALTPRFARIDLEESWAELYELYQKGMLDSPDDFMRYGKAGEESPIKSMCLNVAHDCNLRCQYCFASTGDFGGGRKLMPFEVGKAAIDFLLEKSGSRRNLEVDLFGGEPMMNFDVVKRIVAYAREAEKAKGKNIRFTTTTNAMLLDDEKINFINREMSNVVLSIDGRREVNDRMRRRVDGSGSYDTIMPHIRKLVAGRGDKTYYVRGTYTRENLDFSKDVLHLVDEGFDEVSVEPVVGAESDPYSIRREDLPRIFAEYDTLADEMVRRFREGRGFNFFHFMIDLDEGPCLIKLMRGCGCGNEYVAVTPEGDIYPCHQFVGKPEFIMGNVMNPGEKLVRTDMKEQFSRANLTTKRGCAQCWAKFFCGGGCNANNYAYEGDILHPMGISCELERKRVECALMLHAAKEEMGAE